MCIQFKRALLMGLAAFFQFSACCSSRADVLLGAFPETAIPDASPAGVALNFAPAPGLAAVDKVTVTLAHEWLGDLSLRLIPPSGPGFVLFQRLGVSPTTPEGSSAVLGSFVPGSSNVFVLTPAPYEFARTGVDLGAAAKQAVSTQPGSALPNASVYASQLWEAGPFPAGTWQLLISDSAPLSTGLISSAEIDYTPLSVPEPTTLALLVLSAGVLVRLPKPRDLLNSSSKARRDE